MARSSGRPHHESGRSVGPPDVSFSRRVREAGPDVGGARPDRCVHAEWWWLPRRRGRPVGRRQRWGRRRELPNGLIVAAVRGDRRARDELLALIQPLVLRYCRGKMGRQESVLGSADDVAQEVCVAVVSALGSYQPAGLSFRAFVYGIAAHKVADAFRAIGRNRAEPVAELPDVAVAANGPEQHASDCRALRSPRGAPGASDPATAGGAGAARSRRVVGGGGSPGHRVDDGDGAGDAAPRPGPATAAPSAGPCVRRDDPGLGLGRRRTRADADVGRPGGRPNQASALPTVRAAPTPLITQRAPRAERECRPWRTARSRTTERRGLHGLAGSRRSRLDNGRSSPIEL